MTLTNLQAPTMIPYLKLLRIKQWLKNLMLYFPPFLGGEILRNGVAVKGVLPFIAFCCASSACYILNDFLDAPADAAHPTKKQRPLASGAVNRTTAAMLGIVLSAASILIAVWFTKGFLILLIAYGIISTLYSVKLKAIPVLDIFCISAGFLLRLQAGAEVFGINVSEWLFLSVFLLAIFLSTGKRLCEKQNLGADAGNHRKSLFYYPEGYLDGIMYLTGGAVLVTYAMYTITRHTLLFTVPLCTFGLMRYIFRVKTGAGGDPTESLLKDTQLFLVGFLWVVMVGWGIYGW